MKEATKATTLNVLKQRANMLKNEFDAIVKAIEDIEAQKETEQ